MPDPSKVRIIHIGDPPGASQTPPCVGDCQVADCESPAYYEVQIQTFKGHCGFYRLNLCGSHMGRLEEGEDLTVEYRVELEDLWRSDYDRGVYVYDVRAVEPTTIWLAEDLHNIHQEARHAVALWHGGTKPRDIIGSIGVIHRMYETMNKIMKLSTPKEKESR